ncbi:zinc phosphodiesterase ELAC protein 1-like [Achlya hypogyna]|uniref:protein-histidine N-methyltransferase n=1 Tax=Achlya hypogyna TaxID=1202772 RepID=A0A1V9YBC3_ACHHY|nr:zinc phosphodiesterase ELAC protein 1-like [Achlya hypogyna]
MLARRLRRLRLTTVPKHFADSRSLGPVTAEKSCPFTGFELIFLGTGAGSPSVERNATGLCLQLHGQTWLFDCGEGSLKQMFRSTLRVPSIDRIFITHLHGDHIFGLPGMVCTLNALCSTPLDKVTNLPVKRTISIYGPLGIFSYLNSALSISRATMTNIDIVVHELVPTDEDRDEFCGPTHECLRRDFIHANTSEGALQWDVFEDDTYKVVAGSVAHTIPCFGYVVEEQARPGHINVALAKARGLPPGPLYKDLKKGLSVPLPDGSLLQPHEVMTPDIRGRKVAILGDSSNSSGMLKLARNADVLVHESTLPHALLDQGSLTLHYWPRLRGIQDSAQSAMNYEGLASLLRTSPSSTSLLRDPAALASLSSAVQALRAKERPSSVACSSTSASLAAFAEWFAGETDASAAPIAFQYMGPTQGNGVVATKPIEVGDRVLFVPQRLLLTSSTAHVPGFADLQRDPLLSQFPSAMLALHLLYEVQRGDASPWAQYLRVLPATFHLPLDYAASDFKALEPTPAFAPAVQLLFNSLQQFLYVRIVLQRLLSPPVSLQTFTLDNYLWALSIVLTRQNNVPTDSDPRALALIPGWDLCNHAPGAITTYFDPELGGVVCDAMQRFEAGDQFTIFYGPRPNVELLVYSGFCLPENPLDLLPLPIPHAPDALWKIRSMLLAKINAIVDGDCVSVSVASSGVLADDVARQTLGVLLMDKDGLAKALRSLASLTEWNADVAARADALLQHACQKQADALDATRDAHPVVLAYVQTHRAIVHRALQVAEHKIG